MIFISVRLIASSVIAMASCLFAPLSQASVVYDVSQYYGTSGQYMYSFTMTLSDACATTTCTSSSLLGVSNATFTYYGTPWYQATANYGAPDLYNESFSFNGTAPGDMVFQDRGSLFIDSGTTTFNSQYIASLMSTAPDSSPYFSGVDIWINSLDTDIVYFSQGQPSVTWVSGTSPSPVPLPPSLALLCSGLAGLWISGKRKNKTQVN